MAFKHGLKRMNSILKTSLPAFAAGKNRMWTSKRDIYQRYYAIWLIFRIGWGINR